MARVRTSACAVFSCSIPSPSRLGHVARRVSGIPEVSGASDRDRSWECSTERRASVEVALLRIKPDVARQRFSLLGLSAPSMGRATPSTVVTRLAEAGREAGQCHGRVYLRSPERSPHFWRERSSPCHQGGGVRRQIVRDGARARRRRRPRGPENRQASREALTPKSSLRARRRTRWLRSNPAYAR